MKQIDLADGWAISTRGADGDGLVTITIFEKNTTTETVAILNASQLAKLIFELKHVYLSIAGLYV